MKDKIALFGGAFDPIHNGHISIAKFIKRDFMIDKFYFIPSNNPPHKMPHKASKKDRLKMLMIAIAKLGKEFIISDYELKKDTISYTIDTVKYFRSKYPKDEIYFVVGSDIFATLKTWKHYRELFEYCKFIIVLRYGYGFYALAEQIGEFFFDQLNEGQIILYDEDIDNISSTHIRATKDINDTPKEIMDYIKQNKLYIEE